MKDYNEIADSIFERRSKYFAERKRKRKKVVNLCCAMGCLAFVAGIGVYYLPSNNAINENNENNKNTQALNDYSQEKLEVEESNGLADEQTSKDSTYSNSEDVNADKNGIYVDNAGYEDMSEKSEAIFGGSYTDENGNYVVVLTEDTSENRAVICKELGINESNTIFRTGTYSLSYLTELQAKISNKMSDKELTFVVSSGLYEDSNSIKVKVTTNDEVCLAKLYALDTIGGAIEVEYTSDNPVIDELLEVND